MIDKSNYYYRFIDDLLDRFDFVYHHPELDNIKEFRDSNGVFPFSKLNSKSDYGITESGKDEGLIKFVNTQNLSEVGFIDPTNIKYVDVAPAEKLLKVNEVLISRSRLVGRVAKVMQDFKDATFGSYIIRFKLGEDIEYNIDFIVKYINCRFGQKQITLLKTGSSGENINSGQLLDIRLPKIIESKQEEILKNVNEIESQAIELESEAKRIRKKSGELLLSELGISLPEEEMIDYYYYWFDELGTRLSYGDYHPSVKQLEDSLENAKYEKLSLGKLITLQYDFIEPWKNPNEEYTYIGLENIESYTGRLTDIQISKGREILSKSRVFTKGELMFSGLRPYLNKCFILTDYEEAIGSAELFSCKANEGVSLEYLKWYLLSDITLRQTKWILSGASYPRLDEPDFLNLKIVIPKLIDEQIVITEKIRSIIDKAEAKELEAKKRWKEAKSTLESLILGEITISQK